MYSAQKTKLSIKDFFIFCALRKKNISAPDSKS